MKDILYSKVHTSATRTVIINRLADADEARNIRKANPPSGITNAFEEGLNYLGALVGSQKEEHTTYDESYAMATDSNSSAEQSTCRHRTKERNSLR